MPRLFVVPICKKTPTHVTQKWVGCAQKQLGILCLRLDEQAYDKCNLETQLSQAHGLIIQCGWRHYRTPGWRMPGLRRNTTLPWSPASSAASSSYKNVSHRLGSCVANISAPVPRGTPALYNSRGPQYDKLCTSLTASNLPGLPSDGMILVWIAKPILPAEDVSCAFRASSQEPRPALSPARHRPQQLTV